MEVKIKTGSVIENVTHEDDTRKTQNCNTKVYAGSLFRFVLLATGLVRACT